MSRALLICGNIANPLPSLVQHASQAGFVVTGPGATAPAVALPSWNRRSPLAARTLITQAGHAAAGAAAGTRLTDIVYVHQMELGTVAFHDRSATDLERTVDEQAKGRLFLIREAVAALRREGGGTLTLVLVGAVAAETPPLEADLAAGFLALGRSLFTWYRNEPISLRGYQTDEALLDAFSARLVQELSAAGEKGAGKWQRVSGRSGLFPFSR